MVWNCEKIGQFTFWHPSSPYLASISLKQAWILELANINSCFDNKDCQKLPSATALSLILRENLTLSPLELAMRSKFLWIHSDMHLLCVQYNNGENICVLRFLRIWSAYTQTARLTLTDQLNLKVKCSQPPIASVVECKWIFPCLLSSSSHMMSIIS